MSEADDIELRHVTENCAVSIAMAGHFVRPIGWPMNEPIHAARSGVPMLAWSKAELAQTYHNHEQQLAALDAASGGSDRLTQLLSRRGRVVDALGSVVQRTSRLSDDVLRKVRV